MIISPHGNTLIDRILPDEQKQAILREAGSLSKIILDEEHIKDVKNIARGVYSPLEGFLCKDDFQGVISRMRLASGVIWPIPIVLDCDKKAASKLKEGEEVLLVDENAKPIAVLTLEEKYAYDKEKFAEGVFGTKDRSHPGVEEVYRMGEVLLGGKVGLLDNAKEPFYNFNLDPKETRLLFKERGWDTVAAFQTRNPPHMVHEYLQKCGLELCDGLFINPVMGRKKKGDFKDAVILKAYQALIDNYYPKDRVVMSILPMQMRYAGPREAIFHAIIRKNFGCTHFIVGRDHAGVGNFYGSYDAQKIFDQIEDIGIKPLKFERSFYCRKCRGLATSRTCGHSKEDLVLPSGSSIRQAILEGRELEEGLMRPEVIAAIRAENDPYV